MTACGGDGSVDGAVCVTCSDEALPVTVVAVDGDLARVETGDGCEEVSIALVDAGVGDVVLVHAGEAIARLGRDVGRETP